MVLFDVALSLVGHLVLCWLLRSLLVLSSKSVLSNLLVLSKMSVLSSLLVLSNMSVLSSLLILWGKSVLSSLLIQMSMSVLSSNSSILLSSLSPLLILSNLLLITLVETNISIYALLSLHLGISWPSLLVNQISVLLPGNTLSSLFKLILALREVLLTGLVGFLAKLSLLDVALDEVLVHVLVCLILLSSPEPTSLISPAGSPMMDDDPRIRRYWPRSCTS